MFILETDSIASAASSLDSIASQATDLASTVNGFDTSCDDGDLSSAFSSAKNVIVGNIDACAIKVSNTSSIFNSVVSSHTSLQNSMKFQSSEANASNDSKASGETSGNGGSSGGSYSGGGGYYSGGGSSSGGSSSSGYTGGHTGGYTAATEAIIEAETTIYDEGDALAKDVETSEAEHQTTDASLKEALEKEGITIESYSSDSPNHGQIRIKIKTKDGIKEFNIFEQTEFNQWTNGGWNLSSNGCAVCGTTTIIRAFGDEKYREYTPGNVIDDLNGGNPFNFFGDGIKSTLNKAGVEYKHVTYGPNDAAAMVEQLKKGTPMIASVRGNGEEYAHSSGHTIVLLGMTDDGKVIVGDSYKMFNGSNIYTKEIEEIFPVMCNDPCNDYNVKEVLVIKGNAQELKKQNNNNKTNNTVKDTAIKV